MHSDLTLRAKISKRIILLLCSLIVLQILDGALTLALFYLDIAHEGNPLLSSIIDKPIFMIVKFIGVLFCVIILWDIYKRHQRLATIVTTVFVFFYTGVVIWNASLLIGGLLI